jgi:hypothetical protein
VACIFDFLRGAAGPDHCKGYIKQSEKRPLEDKGVDFIASYIRSLRLLLRSLRGELQDTGQYGFPNCHYKM